jgi:hypothetical protein
VQHGVEFRNIQKQHLQHSKITSATPISNFTTLQHRDLLLQQTNETLAISLKICCCSPSAPPKAPSPAGELRPGLTACPAGMGLQVSHGRAHPHLGSRVCPRVVVVGRPDQGMDASPATTAPWGSVARRHWRAAALTSAPRARI